MTYAEIFAAYYTQYRGDADVPSSSDDEYTIGMRLANEAINHWASYDGTYWKELFVSLLASGDSPTVITGTTQYDAPEDMQEAGGLVKVKDSDGNTVQTYQLIDPHEAQFKSDMSTYAYFTGDPANGFVLNLNPAPPSSLSGKDIDYVYYKKPTEFTTGSDVTEMSNPYFIVHRMLANRFRASRNPYYNSALRDAENALAKMKVDNDSGTWSNPWSVADRSGTSWGT